MTIVDGFLYSASAVSLRVITVIRKKARIISNAIIHFCKLNGRGPGCKKILRINTARMRSSRRRVHRIHDR